MQRIEYILLWEVSPAIALKAIFNVVFIVENRNSAYENVRV